MIGTRQKSGPAMRLEVLAAMTTVRRCGSSCGSRCAQVPAPCDTSLSTSLIAAELSVRIRSKHNDERSIRSPLPWRQATASRSRCSILPRTLGTASRASPYAWQAPSARACSPGTGALRRRAIRRRARGRSVHARDRPCLQRGCRPPCRRP